MKSLLIKYKKQIMYLIFGGLTTLVNIISYFALTRFCHLGISVATVIAWILSVVFAYITNRKWVFESTATGFEQILIEIVVFFGARLFSGALDFGIMYLFVKILNFNDLIIKILSNVIVIILNYIFSNFFIFKKEEASNV